MVLNAMEKLKSPIRQNDFGGLMGTNYRWRTSGVSSHGNSAANLTYSGKYAGSEYAYQSGRYGPIAADILQWRFSPSLETHPQS